KRLDDIEKWYDIGGAVSPGDFDWLIGQVRRQEAELKLYREYYKKLHDELEKEDSADESIGNILQLNILLLISLAALEATE
ncbi:hypothetical protein CHH63_22315, partial [Bacillus licheniformis]